MHERDVFVAALEKEHPAERAAYLDEACGHDLQLRRGVEGLLRSHEEAGDFLEQPFPGVTAAPALKTECMPGRFGDFRIIREIGRGGMGVVYEAEQESLNRRVALKVLARQPLVDPKHRQRFQREARAVARLHHTNIVPIFGVGEADGLLYYVMQLIDGQSLDDVLAELRRLSPSDSATVDESVKRVATAATVTAESLWRDRLPPTVTAPDLSQSAASEGSGDSHPFDVASGASMPSWQRNPGAAEAAGKRLSGAVAQSGSAALAGPSAAACGGSDCTYWDNVARIGIQAAEALDYSHGQGILHRDIKPANLLLDRAGTVWITDFGLAKAEDQPNVTDTGDVVGTLRYMAPEVFRNEADARSDLYSLGLTLYELLSLRPAFEDADRQMLLRRVMHELPPRLRSINPAIPRDLETIVHKAIDRDPAERYAIAQELVDDLRRYLENRPILARRPSLARRATKWAQRNRLIVAILSLSVLLVLAGLAVTAFWYGRQQHRLAEDRRELAQQADERRREAEQALYRALIGQGWALHAARQPGYRARAFEKFHEAAGLNVPDKDLNELGSAVLACLGDPMGLEPVSSPGVAPADSPSLSEEFRRHIQNEAHQLGLPAVRIPRAVTSDGEALALGAGPIRILNRKGEPIGRTNAPLGYVNDLAFTPDDKLLIAASNRGLVVWAFPGLSEHALFRGDTARSVAVDPAGRLMAALHRSGDIELWSLVSSRPLTRFAPTDRPQHVEFSPNGEWLLALDGSGRTVCGWAVTNTPEKVRCRGHAESVWDVKHSPDGRRLVSCANNRTVRMWDATTGALVRSLPEGPGAAGRVAFSPDGTLLACAYSDGTVRFRDVESGRQLLEISSPIRHGSALRFDSGGSRVALGGVGGAAVWAIDRSEDALELDLIWNQVRDDVHDLAIHPEGDELVVLDYAGTLHGWDLRSATHETILQTSSRIDSGCLHFLAEGRLLTFAMRNGGIGIWDWETGQVVRTVGPFARARRLAITRDERWAAAMRSGSRIAVFDLQSGEDLYVLPSESSDVWSLDFSPDGVRLAVGLADGGVTIWNLEQVRRELAAFGLAVPSTAEGGNAVPSRSLE